jgi:hypothetical protein
MAVRRRASLCPSSRSTRWRSWISALSARLACVSPSVRATTRASRSAWASRSARLTASRSRTEAASTSPVAERAMRYPSSCSSPTFIDSTAKGAAPSRGRPEHQGVDGEHRERHAPGAEAERGEDDERQREVAAEGHEPEAQWPAVDDRREAEAREAEAREQDDVGAARRHLAPLVEGQRDRREEDHAADVAEPPGEPGGREARARQPIGRDERADAHGRRDGAEAQDRREQRGDAVRAVQRAPASREALDHGGADEALQRRPDGDGQGDREVDGRGGRLRRGRSRSGSSPATRGRCPARPRAP